MLKNTSLRRQMWLPVIFLGFALIVTATLLVMRTVRLVEESKLQQEALQTRLELTLGWSEMARTLAAGGTGASQAAERLRARGKAIQATLGSPEERGQFERVNAQVEAFLANPAGTAPLAEMEALAQLVASEGQQLRAQITKARMTSVYAVLAIVVLITLLITGSTYYLVQTIIYPVKSLIGLAHHMADGDLTREVRVDRGDELGDLQKSLSAMRNELASMVQKAHEGADSVQTAAAEIASGNLDLSQRTEQTAARVQQTNSAVSDLGVAVRHSAESAATANQLAQQAAQEAVRGGEVVGQVVSTMQEINTSSKRIADIIGTIDGIAFQTNILALNAAVEAARAGEQGRGFAVVAGEVRSLASRSAEAAREIKTLIGASVEKVETGTRLVAEAGSTIEQLVGSVNRVSDVIGEISASTAEQNQHLSGVSGSMVELDQMAQSNAALVEEGAAAAESLKEQAVKLHQLVGSYRVSKAPRMALAPSPALKKPLAAAAPRAAAPRAPAPKPAAPVSAPPAPKAAAPAPADSGDWETF
jgi:methyl-accepting chemotaxis protein